MSSINGIDTDHLSIYVISFAGGDQRNHQLQSEGVQKLCQNWLYGYVDAVDDYDA